MADLYSDTFKLRKVSQTVKQATNGKWSVVYAVDNERLIVNVNQLLGHNVPAADTYLIPCNLICDNQNFGGKCTKTAGRFRQCKLNGYYVRKTFNLR